jgi:exopolysaccharide production protein ExoZ
MNIENKFDIKRLNSLDWQRGLLALSIMMYHLTLWKLEKPDSTHIIGRLGVYGVSMFFVLSGLSMAFVYNKYICDFRSSYNFFIRRIFRIWPLLWMAIFAVTFGNLLFNKDVNWLTVFLNLTTIFGFINPGLYINTGAWSIGNEMVYYALTPGLIFLFNKKILYGNIFLMVTLFVGAYFAADLMSTQYTLAKQWQNYINPFNNLYFYCAGVAIFYNFKYITINNKLALLFLIISLVIFLYYPVVGDQINIVTGLNRAVFSFASILMVIAFYKVNVVLPKFFSVSLTQLGMVTYGVYLLHPVIFQFLEIIFKKLNIITTPVVTIFLTIMLTLIVALFSFNFLESPLIRLGKFITSNKKMDVILGVSGKTNEKTLHN